MQDGASGLYYIFARYMDPETGRFISLDPQLGSLSAPQSMNRYVYCVNNPLGFVDPTGELPWVAIAAGIGAVVGVVVYAIIMDMGRSRCSRSWGSCGGSCDGPHVQPIMGCGDMDCNRWWCRGRRGWWRSWRCC
jgi:RHS repeat-associated protein